MSAPSFSSFPPSFSSFPDLDSAGPSKRSVDAESLKKHDHEKQKKKRKEGTSSSHPHRDTEGKKRREKGRHRSRNSRDHPLSQDEHEQNAEPQSSEKLNRLFYSDRKGDHMNIQYGGLHAGDIPKYRVMDGSRNVLGLPSSFVVFRRAGKGVEVGLKNRWKMSSLTDPSSRALLSKPPTRRILPSTSTTKYEEVDGFIRVSSPKRCAHVKESYRSITGKDDNNSDSSLSSDIEDGSSSDEDDLLTLTAHQETLKSLEQALDSNPRAVDKWLALLNQTLSTIPITSKNATKARCDITVSILSRAFSADPQNATNKVLRLTYLKAGEEFWHESKLKSEWEEALKVGGIEIQMEWLEWKIRRGDSGIDGVVESASRALSSLGIDDDAEIGKVRIFWRIATAMKTAGYSERAMAMFQAQAELSFNAPEHVSQMVFQAQLNELEDFWESEVPRLGEEGAKGWGSWYASKAEQHPSASPQTRQESAILDLDPYRQWSNRELQSDRKQYLPTRSDSETLDPYSTVLFADIRSMVLNIECQAAKKAFRLAWLSVLGLHVPGLSMATSHELDWDDRWNLDYITNPCYLNSIFPSDTDINKLTTDSVAGVVIGRERDYRSPFGPVRCWGYGVSGPLDISSAEPGRACRRGVWTRSDVSNVDEMVIRRLFTGLRIGQNDSEWDTLALAFEAAVNPKNAIKLSKSLLSVNQASLSLWDAHAQLERLRGRLDDARKVYQAILIMSKPNQMQHETGPIWWNWAEMEWLAGDDQQSLNVILKSVGMEGLGSGVTILRAKRCLEDAVDSTSTSIAWKEQEAWIKLRALLELLTAHDPVMALSVFENYSLLDRGGSSRESLTTSSLLMIYYYGFIIKKPMPPSILRERAHAAFEDYPNNSIILGLLLEAEKGQGVWGRVRALLGGNDGKVKDVARRIEEIWIAGWEKGRWLSEIERTRNGLAAAVEHERTRSSPVMWRIYIEFEIRARELQRAKKLIFRAIGECPLVKELYLLAFGPLRSVFAAHELNGLADTMVERGIRLRQGLDEVVDGMDIVDDGLREENGESEDEIEHNAQELRRLMPY